jgi:hypothetical protein
MNAALDPYRLDGTLNLDTHPCLSDPATWPGFREGYEAFKAMLVDAVDGNTPLSLFKFGYGDGQFLKGESAGSATVGFRALSKPFEAIGHARFTHGARLCDRYACEIYPEHAEMFQAFFGRKPDFPAEYIYAAVASRWVFQQFAGRVGLIGAAEKIKLIRHLSADKAYCRYLGIDAFEDLITLPQRFACDDLDATEAAVAAQLARSRSRLFLLGIGHVKSGLLHRLKRHANCVFLDVGQGIDALAGIIDKEKPFFGGWTNFRANNPSLYDELDYLSYLPYDFVHAS